MQLIIFVKPIFSQLAKWGVMAANS